MGDAVPCFIGALRKKARTIKIKSNKPKAPLAKSHYLLITANLPVQVNPFSAVKL
jgi:hypothetical protein